MSIFRFDCLKCFRFLENLSISVEFQNLFAIQKLLRTEIAHVYTKRQFNAWYFFMKFFSDEK